MLTKQIKTIQHASDLYHRATLDQANFQGKSRHDFEGLHQSVHDFRVVDRSVLHTQEIDGAAGPRTTRAATTTYSELLDSSEDTNILLNQLMAEVSSNLDEQGAWSHWWPPMEDLHLPHASV